MNGGGPGRPERSAMSARHNGPSIDVAAARTRADLARCVDRLREMVVRRAGEGVCAVDVGRLAADVNDAVLGRAAVMAEAESGPPPCGYSLMVLGSEGRREQFLATDQDNALVFADSSETARAYFETFGGLFVDILAEAGFPPCPHGVTAANPPWRRSAAAWRDGVVAMLRAVDADAVLSLTQLADARHVHGQPPLCDELRGHVFGLVRDTPLMLKYMAREALRFPTPLGLFQRLVVERQGPARGTLDIKKGGVFPLTQGVKTLALEHGLRETGTLERLRGLCLDGVFSSSRAAGIREAFEFFQDLRLQAQAEAVRAGAAPDNSVRPDVLTVAQRVKLKESLKAVTGFLSFLHTKYGLHLIS